MIVYNFFKKIIIPPDQVPANQPYQNYNYPDRVSSSSDSLGKPIIIYNGNSFSPNILKIKTGTEVVFKNNSLHPISLGGDAKFKDNCYSGFETKNKLMQGQTFSFIFQKTGTWIYSQTLNPEEKGVILAVK